MNAVSVMSGLLAARRRAVIVINHPRLNVVARTFAGWDEPVLRATRGRWTLTSFFSGLEVVELTTVGARSGLPRKVVLGCGRHDGNLLVVGSNWGGPRHPAWVHNLRATPDVDALLRGHRRRVHARELHGAEYDRAWRSLCAAQPWYTGYAERARPRRIALFVLEPQA